MASNALLVFSRSFVRILAAVLESRQPVRRKDTFRPPCLAVHTKAATNDADKKPESFRFVKTDIPNRAGGGMKRVYGLRVNALGAIVNLPCVNLPCRDGGAHWQSAGDCVQGRLAAGDTMLSALQDRLRRLRQVHSIATKKDTPGPVGFKSEALKNMEK